MRFHVSHLVILVSTLLGACAVLPTHAAFPEGGRDKVMSTEVVLPIRQSEIYVFVPVTQNPNAGLIGALVAAAVDDIRTGKAESAAQPLRAALTDFDFDAVLRDDIRTTLATAPWLGTDKVRVMREVTQQSYEQALAGSKAGAVLLVPVDYNLSNDGDVLTVAMWPSLFANNDGLAALAPKSKDSRALRTAPANALYRNNLIFRTRIAPAPSGRDGNIAIWSADNGALLRADLRMAAAKLSQMLADDLQRPDTGPVADTAGTPIKIEFVAEGPLTAGGTEGRVLSSDADGTVVRFPGGVLEYVTPPMIKP
jgi:hypothetical protein